MTQVRKTSYALLCEQPISPNDKLEQLRAGVIAGEDKGLRTGGGSWRQTDTSVCTPLARSACSGLVTPSTCPSRGSPGCALRNRPPCLQARGCAVGHHRRRSTHRLTPRARPSRRITEGLERLHDLIQWLGGLQGRRTAVRDAARNSALKELHQRKKEKGYVDQGK